MKALVFTNKNYKNKTSELARASPIVCQNARTWCRIRLPPADDDNGIGPASCQSKVLFTNKLESSAQKQQKKKSPQSPSLSRSEGFPGHRPVETYLWEERRNDRSGDVILPLQVDHHVDGRTRVDAVLVDDLERHLDVWVAVAEPCHVRHLLIVELQQPDAVLVVQLHDVEHGFDVLLLAALHNVGVKVRQLLQVRVLAPHGLRHHLGELHGGDGRREPSVRAEHVHTSLDEADRLAEDLLGVALEFGAELEAGEVRLQQQVRLDVGVVVSEIGRVVRRDVLKTD